MTQIFESTNIADLQTEINTFITQNIHPINVSLTVAPNGLMYAILLYSTLPEVLNG